MDPRTAVHSRFEGNFTATRLAPIPSLRRINEMSIEEAFAHGELEQNDDIAEYALEGVEEFMHEHPDWNINHAAAIHSYTMEFPGKEASFYHIINNVLRDADRSKITPHLPVLKLVSLGISKLPAMKAIVWRGVKGDVSQNYREMKKEGLPLREWSFQSSTTDMEVTKNFLGDGVRTLFNIQCLTGVNIKKFSAFEEEDEILLLPGTQYKITNVSDMGGGIIIVALEEKKASKEFCPLCEEQKRPMEEQQIQRNAPEPAIRNVWSAVAPMTEKRGYLAAACVAGRLYAIGGYGGSGFTNTVEVYDVASNTWSAVAPMTSKRRELAAACVAGRLYAIGGYDEGDEEKNTVEIYE